MLLLFVHLNLKQGENIIPKIRKHLIVIKNITVTKDIVMREVEDDLGNVTVVDWWIDDVVNYEGFVANGGIMPQRNTFVIVEYINK